MLKSGTTSRRQVPKESSGSLSTLGAAPLPMLAPAALVVSCGGKGSSSAVAETAGASAGNQFFLKDTKSKKIAVFGEEASAAERESASAVLAEKIEARAAAEFASQCASPGKAGIETGPIAALRIEGDKAYALVHGNDGHDYAMPMQMEAGEWRVSAILLIPLS